jgi:23S rRNA pseudouridine955/2504/2580 synthase
MKDLSKDSVTWLEVGEESKASASTTSCCASPRVCPRATFYRILRSGEVRVNKGRVPADYRLAGRRPAARFRLSALPSAIRKPLFRHEILKSSFEDEALIVVDKPAGVAVHGGSGVSFGVIEQLRRARPWRSSSNWPIGWTGRPRACWWWPRSASP